MNRKFWGSGRRLCENVMITTTTKLFEISVDVTGVTELTIELQGNLQ